MKFIMQYVIFISRVILFVFPSVRRHFLLSRELKKSMSVQLKMEKLKVQKFLFFFFCTLGVGGGQGFTKQNKTMKIFDDLNRCKKIVNMQASIPPQKNANILSRTCTLPFLWGGGMIENRACWREVKIPNKYGGVI